MQAIALPVPVNPATTSNPIGWTVLAGSSGFLAGTYIYNNFDEQILDAIDWVLNENTGADGENTSSSSGNSCPIPGTTPGRKTKGRSKLFEKPGDFDTANGDFDNLDPAGVRGIPSGGRIGTLPNGDKIIVRPGSTDGRPTIEIQRGKNKTKIRYGQ